MTIRTMLWLAPVGLVVILAAWAGMQWDGGNRGDALNALACCPPTTPRLTRTLGQPNGGRLEPTGGGDMSESVPLWPVIYPPALVQFYSSLVVSQFEI